jgi:hypothetical protein
MQFADILVCIDGSSTGRKRTELALALAVRSHARVIGYYLAPHQDRRGGEFIRLSLHALKPPTAITCSDLQPECFNYFVSDAAMLTIARATATQ